MRGAFVFALAGGAFLALYGPRLVEFVFGSQFSPAGDPLRALLPGAVALSILIVAQNDLAGRGRIWTVAGIAASAVGANIVLALLLVPSFGATGAGVASSVTYVLAAAWFLLVFRRATREGSPDRSSGQVLDELPVGIS
jgi:O-antigen/teichoic acid export membrane protein